MPNKKRTLLLSARESAEFRGHELDNFKLLSTGVWHSYCSNGGCNMEAVVNTNPAPNEIGISGEAVALNCWILDM